jgi:hypothetical protein
MNSANKNRAHKPSKGERLRWSPLKKQSSVQVTDDMLESRRISEKEIQNKQRLLNGQLTLLVP